MKTACYSAALIAILSLVNQIVAGAVLESRVVQHLDPGWTAHDSVYNLVVGAIGGMALLTCWVLAVYVWSSMPRTGVSHLIALPFLVVLGFLWSPFYLLARTAAAFPGRGKGDPDRVI
jgi:hypothetical protein